MGLRLNIAGATALALILLGLAIGYAYTRWVTDRDAAFWVDHTHQVIESTLTVFPEMQAVTAAQRDFLLSDGKGSLNSYRGAVAAIRSSEASIANLVTDNPEQVRHVAKMRASLDAWLNGQTGMIALSQDGRAGEARRRVSSGALRLLATRARADVEEMAATERRLLALRTTELRRGNRLNDVIALSMAAVALGGLIAMITALAETNQSLSKAMDDVRRTREERNTSQALMETVFSSIPEYIMVLNSEAGRGFSVADINPALANVFNVDRGSVRGRTLVDLFGQEHGERLSALYEGVRESREPILTRGPTTVVPGEPRVWEAILAPVISQSGTVDQIVGAIRDVTEQVRAETRLRESQRMEAIGQLTGGVAHDFNNLLQVIRGNLELLLPTVENDPTARRRVEHAILGADRAAQLTSQLLAFARRQALTPEVIDLTRLAMDMSALLRRTLGEPITVETAVAPGLWRTLADPSQVESAILNLALNAREAMPIGGKLTLRLDNVVLKPAEAAELELTGQDFVLIDVEDTGEGMTPEVLDRAFEPFFTTKPEGKGTGLGLSMVYGFVRQSQGAVRIESRLNCGTRVRIWLPRADLREVAAATSEAA